MKVLVIPEDFRKDQYLLKPIVAKMFAEIGKPRANVTICVQPLMGGVARATSWEAIEGVIDSYPTVDMFLLIVDRDGASGRRVALDRLEALARDKLRPDRVLFAANIWQEIEVLALAGQRLPKEWSWAEIRSEVHPKEIYYDPYVRSRGLDDGPYGGRMVLGLEAARNYKRVRSRCKEDIAELEDRAREWI